LAKADHPSDARLVPNPAGHLFLVIRAGTGIAHQRAALNPVFDAYSFASQHPSFHS
jgi:hypothetical protein